MCMCTFLDALGAYLSAIRMHFIGPIMNRLIHVGLPINKFEMNKKNTR